MNVLTDISTLKNVIKEFKEGGLPVLEMESERTLSDIIRYANRQYYDAHPVMTDNEFDIIKEYFGSKYPENPVVMDIGAPVDVERVRLPYFMGSMDKIKPDTGALQKWTKKYSGPYVLSYKLDGVSGLYTTMNGTQRLYTRGDGESGQDISHYIPHLRLPKTPNIVIRGEFIIPKAVFKERYEKDFANPRNMVAGIINSRTVNPAIKDIHFVAYEVIVPEGKTPSQQMEYLATLNVRVVHNLTRPEITNETLSTYLQEWRDNSEYEIDGVIVEDDHVHPRTRGNPEYAFAFKMVLTDQIGEAKVVNVEWNASKDGYLKPTIVIEPVRIGGVTITRATGQNARFIKDNRIGIGALVQIVRSGDVIPNIHKVVVPAESPKMPTVAYKWTRSGVDVVLEDMESDDTVKFKNIVFFFTTIGVKGLGEGTLQKIYDAGHNTVGDIIALEEEDLVDIPGIGKTLALKIVSGIKERLEESSLATLMYASNIFGRSFGEKRLESIVKAEPNILRSEDTDDERVERISRIKGISEAGAKEFVERIDSFIEFLEECDLEDKLDVVEESEENVEEHELRGRTIVLTGKRNKDIQDFLKRIKAIEGSSVSKTTFMVVADDVDADSTKLKRARELDIQIMSTADFIEEYL